MSLWYNIINILGGFSMTVAIAIKINNGLVLATDSASAIGEFNDTQTKIHYTYYNADKLFNLKKGAPIGCLTWGDGSIKGISISTLIKDFRNKLKNLKDELNIENVTNKFISFLEEFIDEEYENIKVGFLIAGYSKVNNNTPEMYLIEIKDETISKKGLPSENNFSIFWFGDIDFLSRFILGFDPDMEFLLKNNGFDEELVDEILEISKNNLSIPLGVSEMPIQDAIDLADFLVEICKKTSKFVPGPQIIGGPTDIAVITKHEGFKWIKRKHYYTQDLNIIIED